MSLKNTLANVLKTLQEFLNSTESSGYDFLIQRALNISIDFWDQLPSIDGLDNDQLISISICLQYYLKDEFCREQRYNSTLDQNDIEELKTFIMMVEDEI